MNIQDLITATGGSQATWLNALVQYVDQQDGDLLESNEHLAAVLGNLSHTLHTGDAATLASANAYTDAAVLGASNGLIDSGTF